MSFGLGQILGEIFFGEEILITEKCDKQDLGGREFWSRFKGELIKDKIAFFLFCIAGNNLRRNTFKILPLHVGIKNQLVKEIHN